MPVLRLILDPEGAAFDVDDAMLIGACATQLAAQLGYPTTDGSGVPVIYQLRLTSKGDFLPNDRRFRDLQLAPGTRFALASSTASAPTRPVQAATQRKPRPRHLWSRRAFLTTGTLTAFAVTGLGTGLAVALAQRYLGRKRPAVVPLVTPAASPTIARRSITATPALRFASHQQTVRVVAWSPNGRYLASGGDDGLLLVWGTDGVVRQRVAHPAAVTALAWSPESQRLVTGAANQVIFLTALTGTVLASFPHAHLATVTSLAWTAHNQQQVVSGALDQRAIVWQTTQYQPQTVFNRHAALSLGQQMVRRSPPLRTAALCACGTPKAGGKSTHSTRMPAYPCAPLPSPPPAHGSRLAEMTASSVSGMGSRASIRA
jgi:WD domain, G-beta repeat